MLQSVTSRRDDLFDYSMQQQTLQSEDLKKKYTTSFPHPVLQRALCTYVKQSQSVNKQTQQTS